MENQTKGIDSSSMPLITVRNLWWIDNSLHKNLRHSGRRISGEPESGAFQATGFPLSWKWPKYLFNAFPAQDTSRTN